MSLLPRRAPHRLAVVIAVLLLATSANTAAAAVTWRTVGTFTDVPVGFARTTHMSHGWRHVLLTDRWGNVLHRRQPAAGGAWSARRLLGPGPTTRRAESFAMASTGAALHVAWIERGGTEGAPSESYWVAWRGNDVQGDGTRWRAIRVVGSGYGGTDGVAVAASGDHAVIAWSAAAYRSQAYEVRYAETFDGGATWSSGSIGPGQRPAVAIGRLGVLVAYQAGSYPERRLQAVLRRGATWSAPVELSARLSGFGWYHEAEYDVAMSGERAAVTWGTSDGVFVRVLGTDGWRTPVRLARRKASPPGLVQEPPMLPVVALVGSSRIGVAWSEPSPYVDIDEETYTRDDVWWRETRDGTTWSAPRLVMGGVRNVNLGRVVVDARFAGENERDVVVRESPAWGHWGTPKGWVRVGSGRCW